MGSSNSGGTSTTVSSALASNVTAVYSTDYGAFAAVKSGGSVVTWGHSSNGADSATVSSALASDVTAVYSTDRAFAAVKSGGSVVTWGDSSYGGNSTTVSSALASNVTAVYSTSYAFAAVKSGGSVVTWATPATVATRPRYRALWHRTSQRCTLLITERLQGEEWGQRGDVGLLLLRWQLGHGIERAGIGRHSGVLC